MNIPGKITAELRIGNHIAVCALENDIRDLPLDAQYQILDEITHKLKIEFMKGLKINF